MPIDIPVFMLTVLALAMVPGVNNATITRQVLERGRRAGWVTVAGTSTGIFIWATAAALGVSSLLAATPLAYAVVRLTGAVILAWLGITSLRKGLRMRTAARQGRAQRAEPALLERRPSGRLNLFNSYGVGVASSLGNPKAGVVAVSLLPQFVAAGGPVTWSLLGLGALWAAVSGTWFTGFVWLVDRVSERLRDSRNAAILQLITGIGLIGLATATVVTY